MRQAIVDMLEAFELAYGPRKVDPARQAVVWDRALGDLPEEAISRGAMLVLQHHRGWWPAPGEVREAVEGSIVKVPKHETDVWGRKILGSNGHQVESWTAVRVPYGSGLAAGNLDLDALPEGCRALTTTKTPALPEAAR